ncbi:MAG TPA: hypothetical protein VIV11_26020 [Kofleriaceae bacterium]
MRRRGLAWLLAGTFGAAAAIVLLVIEQVAGRAPTDRGTGGILILVALTVAAIGARRLLLLPAFLRRPEDIVRIDRHVPGRQDDMLIVMANGRAYHFEAPAVEREQIADALVKQVGFNLLRMRIVKR